MKVCLLSWRGACHEGRRHRDDRVYSELQCPSEIPRHALYPDTPSRDARLLKWPRDNHGIKQSADSTVWLTHPSWPFSGWFLRTLLKVSTASTALQCCVELVLANDGDASCISSTLSRVIHQPSRRWVSQMSRARTLIPRHELYQP